jgi:hypothetical protein
VFPGLVALLGYNLALETKKDQLDGQIVFRWQSLSNNPPAAKPKLRIVSSDNLTVSDMTWTPRDGTRPTEYWFASEMITDVVRFSVPTLEPGEYNLLLEWQNSTTGVLLNTSDGQVSVVLERFRR